MFVQPENLAVISNKLNPKRGFTILEVLITTLLVGVSIFALMETFNRGVFGFGDVENYSLALSLTQRKLEQIKGSSFANVSIINFPAAKTQVSDFTKFDQQVTITSAHADLKQIDVVTYWTVPNGETSVSLSTYVVNG